MDPTASKSMGRHPLLLMREPADPPTPLHPRAVQTEILDCLPEDSPEARASRRDLRVINRLLGSRSWFERSLRDHLRGGEGVLELGAGSGELGCALSASVPNLAGLDLCQRPVAWPKRSPWFETDVREFSNWAAYPIVIGNLFFHHFDATELEHLGAHLNQHARVIIASEPLRARRSRALLSLVCPLIRAHPVTRHDGRVSIAAGFRGDELALWLGLDASRWRWTVQETWLGANRLVAEKRA